MLEKVREPWRAKSGKSIIAYVLFGLICFIFVFVGIVPDNNGAGSVGAAATVNDKVISVMDFQERVSMLEQQMGGANQDVPAAQRQMRAKMVRERAINDLVAYEVVFQSAQGIGVLSTPAATRSMIVNIPAFQDQGRFARELYDRYLSYRNMTAADFEGRVQRDVVVGQVRDLFLTAWKAPNAVTALTQQAQATKVNLEFVKITNDSLAKAGLVTDTEVKAFLANEEGKKKVASYYGSHSADYTGKEEVHARHILIKGGTVESLKKIKGIREEAIKGNFAELAKKYSEDEGSKDNGGDLQFFGRGAMVKEFEDVAFSGPIGEISQPVKTDFGYHLIKVEEKRGGKVTPLEQVENDIAKKLISDEIREKALEGLSADLKNKKDIGATLAKLKVKWEETGDFSLAGYGIPKIQGGERVLDSALQLKPGETYPDLVREGEVAYVLRLKKISIGVAKEDDPMAAMLAMQGGSGAEALGVWAEELRKAARININDRLLQQ